MPDVADMHTPRGPRLGFLGTGWIGRHRMAAILAAGAAEAVAVADPSPEMAREAAALAPGVAIVSSLDEMLALGLDGVVIATPSALHAAQSIQALQAGAAVFCQKPLGRDAAETEAVVDAARASDRLLGVDLSYRHTAGMQAIAPLLRQGTLGRLFAIDLTFHNAYGPDKPWFYDRAQSGGGCVMDLGIHLVDLALWLTGAEPTEATSTLYAAGKRLAVGRGSALATNGEGNGPLVANKVKEAVEDFATATLTLAGGIVVRLACSWRLHAGRDAVIAASFYGTEGGASFRNVGGSFYDFAAEHHVGTGSTPLAAPPDEWGGRAAVDWARRLAGGARFDPAAGEFVAAARALDLIYGAAR